MAELRKLMLVAIVAMVFCIGCTESSESTFVGFEYEPMNSEQELVYEDVTYGCELDTIVNRLYTVEQYVRGNIVLYEGDKKLRENKFEHSLNLEATFTVEPEQVYVRKKENLSDVAVTSVDTYEVDDASADEGIFTRTTLEKNYEFFFNEGEIVSVKAISEKMAYRSHEFDYASINEVLYHRFDAKLNEDISNADSTVYDIDLYFLVDVACSKEEVNKKYEVRVPVQRVYREAPADAITTIEEIDYMAEFATRENELYTVRQFVTGSYVTRLRDEEISRKDLKYDLNLNALFTQPEDVYVDSEEKLNIVALKSSNSNDEFVEHNVIDEFTITTHSRNYEFNFNEGEVVDVATMYQSLSNEDTTFDYTKIKNVRFIESKAKLNGDISSDDIIVYDVELLFAIELTMGNSSGEIQTHNVRVSYHRIYVPEKPDTFTTIMENVDYVGEFDTASKRLYTVEQKVNGEWVTYKNDEEEMSREGFSRDLNLEALFDVPEVVYVGSELQLGEVALASSSKDGDKVNATEEDGFTTTNRTMNYHFRFNENERVVTSTEYEKVSYGEDEFVYSSIDNVRYSKYDASINEKKTNQDSTVYDVTLYFNVDVKRQERTATRTTSQSETYLVAVPYMRVCKHMTPSVSDEFIKKSVRDVKREIVSNGVEKVSFTEYELWSLSGEKNAKTISLDLYFGFTNPTDQTIYTENTGYTTTSNGDVEVSETSSKDGNWTVYTKTNSYSSTADNGHKSFTNKYAYNSQKAVYKNEYYEVEFDYGSWSISEGSSSVGNKSGETTYNGKTYEVYPYVNNVSYVYDVTTDSYTGNGKANVNICIAKEEDVLIGKTYRDVSREIISSTSEKVSFTEVEIWSLSGEKNTKTISKVLNFGFTNPANQTVYTENTNYSTRSNGKVAGNETSSKDGNWTVYTKTNSYSSTADNGHKTFTNKYAYNSQKAVYKNEYYEVEFDYGSWLISEGSSSVGNKSGETTYNGKTYEVYPYVNNVSYVYDVTTDSYTGNGKAEVNICIAKEEPKITPDSWGKIVGAGISAVPADDVRGDYALKCLCIRTENGAVAITFDMDTDIPSVETILAGNFVTGDYSSEYNSGFYLNGNWMPAIAKDLTDRIAYYQGDVCKRNIRHTTLRMWDWRDGNLSTVVDGYSFFVSNDGTLTINYNGVTVLSLR